MRKSTLALGLVLGCFAFGVSGVVTNVLAEEHGGNKGAEHKEVCSACKMEMKAGELLCEDCGGALKEGKEGKEHCDHCKADKQGVCKHCYDAKHKEHK